MHVIPGGRWLNHALAPQSESGTSAGFALKCRMLQKGRDHDHRHASGGSGLPLLNLFWTMFELFLSVLLFRIIIDIFRSQDLGGWGKSLWLIFVIVLPFLGVLIYLVVRGGSMAQRDVRQAQEADAATRRHIQSAAGTSTSTAKQLTKLVGLRDLWGSNIRPMTLLAQAACRYSLMRPRRIGCRTMRRACLRDWGVRVAVGAAAGLRWGRCDGVEGA